MNNPRWKEASRGDVVAMGHNAPCQYCGHAASRHYALRGQCEIPGCSCDVSEAVKSSPAIAAEASSSQGKKVVAGVEWWCRKCDDRGTYRGTCQHCGARIHPTEARSIGFVATIDAGENADREPSQ